MEESNVDNDLVSSGEESETNDREQRFKANYEAALMEGCEKSSSSSNESLRRDCPELYNDYRANVMGHLKCLEGGTTQVELDTYRDGRSPPTIRELDGEDEEASLELRRERIGVEWCIGADTMSVRDERSVRVQDEELDGHLSSNSTYELNRHIPSNSTNEVNEHMSSNSTDELNEHMSSNGTDETNEHMSSNSTDELNEHVSSNSTDELNRHISSNSIEESTEHTSSNSTEESNGPMSSNSTSSVDEEAPEYLADSALPMHVKINERTCNNNIASVFEETSPDTTVSNNKETGGQMPDDAPLINKGTDVPGDIPPNCEEMVAWHLPDYTQSGNEETDGRLCSSLNADYVLTGNKEMVGHLTSSLSNVEIHKPLPDNALTANGETVWYLSSSLNNTERHESMPDYALAGNKEMVECFPSSLITADIYGHMPDCSLTENKEMYKSVDLDGHQAYVLDYSSINDQTYRRVPNRNLSPGLNKLDYTSINDQTGGLVPNRNLSPGLNELNYTSINDQTGGQVSNHKPSGLNQDIYVPATLHYTPTSDKTDGHMPYRSVSTMNERLCARRRDELRRSAALTKKEEFGRPAEHGVFTADYSKDTRRLPPPSSRSMEDLRPPVRPPPPKVSFFSFEQELSRCENALREAKAELREERKKQVVVDTFRMNLLEVDRMCSEEMNRLRQDAARLEPLNQMAAEWERDSRQAFWYDQYNREQQQSVGRDCFVKSYVRRIGDPETCQVGEVYPPTV